MKRKAWTTLREMAGPSGLGHCELGKPPGGADGPR